MNILLINPEKLINPPLGLLYIGSILKAYGHNVELAEVPYGLVDADRSEFVKVKITQLHPELIGITCMSMQSGIVKRMIRGIRGERSDFKIVVGGVHPTVDSHEVIGWGADIAVRGEGDVTILEIAESLGGARTLASIAGITYRSAGNVVDNVDRSLIKDLNELPPLSYGLLDKGRFRMRSYSIRGFWLRCGWIMTSRGCPGRCTFCASKSMHGRVVREYALEKVLDEVRCLKRNYKIEGLWIFDDTFTLKEKRVVSFCEELKRQRINVRWACQARVDTFTSRMAKAMKDSGCVQVDFGVESGSQKVLDGIKKDIKCEETKRSFGIARDNGLRALATVMVGLPEEDSDDLRLTEGLIKEIQPDFVAPFFATPYPGTELYKTASENGWIDISTEINWQQMEEPIMAAGLPRQELKKWLERLLNYNRSVLFDYMAQPLFLYDILKTLLNHPRYIFRIIRCCVKGRKQDLINLFLYIFRREMVNG